MMENAVSANEFLNQWCGTKEINYSESLDSLFKYAVPKTIEVLVEKSRIITTQSSVTEGTAFRELITLWLAQNPMQFGFENTLLWTIGEVIKK